MSRLSIVLVVALAAGTSAGLPAAAANGGRSHRASSHHTFKAPAKRSRLLTVRRPTRVPVTRDFDPVPLGGGPIANLVRDVREVYGHDLPLDLDQPFGPRVFRDF